MGCTFGKFTKTKKFRLHVTCLDYIAQHAQFKVRIRVNVRRGLYRLRAHSQLLAQVWLKPSAEQSFLYGNHVLKVSHSLALVLYEALTESEPSFMS